MATNQTLKEFVETFPSQHAAALKIGCTQETLNRWLNGHVSPTGITLLRFKQLGIQVD